MPLTLHNTLTKRKEPFTPITPGRVTMYCCGVTVYADDIRDRLAAMGIAVVDQPDGAVRWHRQQINDSEPNYCP